MVMLTAPNSDEYGLTPVQLGTTALTDVAVDYSCGDPTLAECWSAEVSGLTWGPSPSTTGVSTDITLYNGKDNTDILAALGSEYAAAYHCATLDDGVNPVGTWYLPSYVELEDAYFESGSTAAALFTSDDYWSSTEFSDDPEVIVWGLFTYYGYMDYYNKNLVDSVRCLR